MNPYDHAYSLAKALKNSNEYQSYSQVRDKLVANEKVLAMFKDLREKEIALTQKQMMGKEISEEEMGQYQKLKDLTIIHSLIKDYLEKEERLHILMMDIQRIIGEAIHVGIDDNKGESS